MEKNVEDSQHLHPSVSDGFHVLKAFTLSDYNTLETALRVAYLRTPSLSPSEIKSVGDGALLQDPYRENISAPATIAPITQPYIFLLVFGGEMLGIASAQPKIVAFESCQCLLSPAFLASLIEILERVGCALVYADCFQQETVGSP